ncbi:MAG: hypothetical protein ACRCT8_04490, partial [Lacipirellulaceae bacterium]
IDPAQTRLGDALERVAIDNAGTPLAAVVVLSDGRVSGGADPLTAAERLGELGAALHTVGFGPVTAPPNTALRNLAAPQRVFAGDDVAVTCAASVVGSEIDSIAVELWLAPLGDSLENSLEATTIDDGAFRRVAAGTLSLAGGADDEPRLATTSIEFEAPAVGRYALEARVAPPPNDADPRDNRLRVSLESVDRRSRVLLVAGGPMRDFHFLRDGLHRDRAFEVDVLLQSASGAVSQDASRVLDAPPGTIDDLEAYDAVLAFDADWGAYGDEPLAALAQWVAKRGGGLVLAPGRVFDPAWRRSAEGSPLAALMPIELDDDALVGSTTLDANDEPRKVLLTPAGRQADFLDPAGDGAAWESFLGLYATPPTSRAKLGATVYAELAGAEPLPWVVEQPYGAGRVAYLAPAEVWRLRAVDPAWFTAFYTKLVRRVAEGRIAGPSAAGTLYFDQPRYDLNATMQVRLARAEGVEADTAVAPLRWRRPDGRLTEVPWSPDPADAAGRIASLPADAAGTHRVSVALSGQARDLPSDVAALDASVEVSLPEGESLAVTRDAGLLAAIAAQAKGASYASLAEAIAAGPRSIATLCPSRAETKTVLGPPDERVTAAVSRWSLGLVAGALVAEWGLRRWWRLA